MAKKRTNLKAINDELNDLDWDPPLRRARVKNRTRYDVKFFWPDGSSIRWRSNEKRALTRQEMVAGLQDIIDAIKPEPVVTVTTGTS